MSVSNSRRVDRLTLVVGLVAILWFPRWDVIFDYLLPVHLPEGYGVPIENFIRGRGYHFERHSVITEDGYKIEFHRISNPNVTGQDKRSPVMLAPIITCTSKTQVAFNNSASFLFANAGFDVWVMNHRGSAYGREHIKFDEKRDMSEFYNFSLIEPSVYDFLAQIRHVQEVTAKKKVIIVAYSLGVASFMTMLAHKPAMQNVIESAVLYGGTFSPCFTEAGLGVGLSIYLNYYFADILDYFGYTYVEGAPNLMSRLPSAKRFVTFMMGISGKELMHETHDPIQLETLEERTSFHMARHILQNGFPGCDGRLREFDYDFGLVTKLLTSIGLRSARNIQVYGTPEPPAHAIEKVSFPVKYYYAEGDHEVPPKAAIRFVERLKIPPADVHAIAEEKFKHLNFIFYRGRLHFIDHAIDFLKGEPSQWDPHVFDEPSTH